MRIRRAVSVIEVLTALVLLTVGVSAYARAAAAIGRLENLARLRRAVAAVEQARLDSVAGLPCGMSRAGAAVHQGIREAWSIAPRGNAVLLDQRIEVPARGSLARRRQIALPCVP